MKLAMVVRRLSRQGGTERFVEGLARYAVGQGHEVHLWCFGADLVIQGVEVHRLAPEGRGRIGRQWALQRALTRIPRDDFDLVLGFMRGPGFDLFRAGGGCHRAWMENSGGGLADQFELRLDRRAVLTAGVVVVNSELARRDLQKHYGLPSERTRLIRNGVDLVRFQPALASPGSGQRLGFLGSGFRRKGLDRCLRALPLLPGVELHVAGRDRWQARYERLASRLGVSDRVCFYGAVDDPEKWLLTLDALVLPTRYDSCANACLEAMACGIPVISSAQNGASELLPETWMCLEDPDDPQTLANALERALHDSTLGARCRDSIESWPQGRAVQDLMQVVQEQIA
jgi:UDP-glucose:(heptosyl)LPS alpha-1,3-glucosyltransferase